MSDPEVTVVTSCTVEVATLSDGSVVLRQRPNLSSEFKSMPILQPDGFRRVFVVGSTIAECQMRLSDPSASAGGDGRGVGKMPGRL